MPFALPGQSIVSRRGGRVVVGGVAAVAAAISSINAEGWSAEWASGTPPTFTPDTALQTINVTRKGYDATGALRSDIVDAIGFIGRKRQAYPSDTTPTPSTIVLEDYLYSTDSIPGVLNNSGEISPKPVAAWAMPHRSVVGDTLALEVVAFHRDARNGRHVPIVEFTLSDGTTTLTQNVTATVVSPLPGAIPVVVYRASFSGLNAALATGLVTANARVKPWIGDPASVLYSGDSSDARDFSPRYFLHDANLAANPPFAYVQTAANGGNDGAGVASTNATTAAASPFATPAAAANAIIALNGAVDGGRIRVGEGEFILTSWTASRIQRVGAITIERAPNVARANAIVSWGASGFTPNLTSGLTIPTGTGCIRFGDITVKRTGTGFLSGGASARLEILWDGCALDDGSISGTWLTRSDDYFFNVDFANLAGSCLAGNTNGQKRIFRGCVGDLNDGSWESWWTIGNTFTRAGAGTPLAANVTKGGIVFANKFLNHNTTNGVLGANGGSPGDVITGYWRVQNLFELTRTSAGPTLRTSADGITRGSAVHCGDEYNTVTGQGSAGRTNRFYDNNTDGDRRLHKLHRDRGNIYVQLNTKGDVDIQTTAATGNQAYQQGVACQGNWTQFRVNTDGANVEKQSYPGRKSVIGTSTSVRNDPGYTNYQAVTSAGAGAGGGDYRLTGSAPARGLVLAASLSHDLAGQARPVTNDTPGAYA